MSSETFVSAMLLITGVVAAAILIVAVLPVIWGMVGTFSSASAATDRSMRTDFKIVTTYAKYGVAQTIYYAGANVSVWIKNIGTVPIGTNELKSADVFVGKSDNFYHATLSSGVPPWPFQRAKDTNYNLWYYTLYEPIATQNNNLWDPGETLQIDTFADGHTTSGLTASGQSVYFQLTLFNGGTRSSVFTAI